MTRSALIGWLGLAAAGVMVAACGGGGGGGGGDETILRGGIMLPAAARCADCSNDGVDLVVFGLFHNAPPDAPIAALQTDAQGEFETADLSAALAASPASPDTNGDGNRTFIVLATVNDSGAAIGGAISVPVGDTAEKDYSDTTHVACLATIFLARGTEPSGDPGCVVRATCAGQPEGCIETVDPDAIDADRIDTLETAAAFISDDVTFPDDVARAACAVIDCTDGGAATATRACVEGEFAG